VVEIYDKPVRVYPEKPKKKILGRQKSPLKVVGRIGSMDQENDLTRMGWIPVTDGYRGYVYFNGKPILAQLKRRFGREYHIFLHEPDVKIFSIHDLQCLNYSGKGWYYVHMEKGKEGNGNPLALINCVQDKLSKNEKEED